MRPTQIVLLLLLFIFSLKVSAQDKKLPFGEVDSESLKMTAYAKDSSVDAIVLYDYADVSFGLSTGNYAITMEYHGRIKILKKSALDRATIKLSLARYGHPNDEIISNIRGFTHNIENGEVKKEKLTKEMIFTEKTSDNLTTTRFTMPNVKEGSVIEYSYRLQTPLSVSINPKTWTFQSDIPVAWSEYRISIPNYFYYRMLMSGYLPLHISDNRAENVKLGGDYVSGTSYRFVVKDAPAFSNEPFITTAADYLSKIDFELASYDIPGLGMKDFSLDYNSMNKMLLEHEEFGEVLKKTNFMKDAAQEINAKSKDSTVLIQSAINYIRSKIKWNNRSSIWTKNLKKVLEKGEGDAADMNFALIALLREMGFDANPVILSTRDNGRIHEQYAIRKRFNYVVAHIKKGPKDMFLDATDEFLPAGVLPVHCLNHTGWLVHPQNMQMVSMEPIEKDAEYENVILKITEDGELVGRVSKSYGGYSGWSSRTAYKSDGKEKFLEAIKKGKPSWVISKADYRKVEDITSSMEANYEVTINDHLTVAGNMMYLKPMLTEGHVENPFKDTERAFPIDFAHPIEETFIATYEIPAGYQVVELPKNASVSLPNSGGRFNFAISQNENKITINSRIAFRKSLYAADEYGLLREFYDKIVEKHAEQIVLKKM